MSELKPCPFCGDRPNEEWHDYRGGTTQIYCNNPDCPMNNVDTPLSDPLYSRANWNTRPIEDALTARAENAEKALNDAGDVIASIVACCTYGSEEQAKAGAYGISHEAFTRIDTFIRKYGDLLQAIDPKKGGE